jgi:hypothetical protein
MAELHTWRGAGQQLCLLTAGQMQVHLLTLSTQSTYPCASKSRESQPCARQHAACPARRAVTHPCCPTLQVATCTCLAPTHRPT